MNEPTRQEANDLYLKWLGGYADQETLQAEIVRLRSVLQAVINNMESRRPNDFIAEIMFGQAVLDTIPDEDLLENFALHPMLEGQE